MKTQLAFLISSLTMCLAHAGEASYQISPLRPVAEMIRLSIPYSFGVHQGSASVLQGSVVTNDADRVLKARFKIPVTSLTTGNALRDCHMLESLGLDYEQSRFPNDHVCGEGDLLPTSGPDSIKFPNITVDFQEMSLAQDPYAIGIPQITSVKIKLNIHGITKVYDCEKVIITKLVHPNGTEGFRVLTKLNISLRDFNVQVKPLRLGPVSVKVKDGITVDVDVDLMKR